VFHLCRVMVGVGNAGTSQLVSGTPVLFFGISILCQFRLSFVPELASVTKALYSNFHQHLPI
jgi:hypothetical protein